jgi:hypothetical protein
MDRYVKTDDGYFIWANFKGESIHPSEGPVIFIKLKTWYPCWLVKLIVSYKIWRNK